MPETAFSMYFCNGFHSVIVDRIFEFLLLSKSLILFIYILQVFITQSCSIISSFMLKRQNQLTFGANYFGKVRYNQFVWKFFWQCTRLFFDFLIMLVVYFNTFWDFCLYSIFLQQIHLKKNVYYSSGSYFFFLELLT